MSPWAAAFLLCCCCCCSWSAVTAAAVSRPPLLVVVSFDGFRPDYVQPDVTPHLAKFRDEAAAPPYMRAAFPTKTFVNHFTIATGLNPERHGVLDNFAFDHNGKKMHSSYEQFHHDESVVPIWTQNENSGDDRHSGVLMWPGSEHPYQGKLSTYVQRYNRSMSWNDRVDTIITWIKDEKQPANLVLAYFEEPDRTSHMVIGSQEVQDQILRVDNTVKYLLEQIKNNQLEDELNLIILSDHGMDTVTFDRIIFLDNYLFNGSYNAIVTGPNVFIRPDASMFDEIYRNLTEGAKISGTFDVYKKDELPDRWHMKKTTVLDGIIYLLAKPGHAFWYDLFDTILKNKTREEFKVGAHGYDNTEPAMRAMFIASGPAFKPHFKSQPFDNVNLCSLFSHVLQLPDDPRIVGVPSDGTLAPVQQMLLKSGSGSSASAPMPHVRGIMIMSSAAVLLHVFTRRLQ